MKFTYDFAKINGKVPMIEETIQALPGFLQVVVAAEYSHTAWKEIIQCIGITLVISLAIQLLIVIMFHPVLMIVGDVLRRRRIF